MTARFAGIVATFSAVLLGGGCHSNRVEINGLEIKPTLEDRKEDGSLFTPETQSILRGNHLLENLKGLDIQVRDDDRARVIMKCGEAGEVTYDNIPLDQLVPRLHYPPASPPDEFDAFNLMLAEYSRNSIDFPRGHGDDAIAHFQGPFDDEAAPWTLGADYEFKANPKYTPNRMSFTNNCLGPGLWELNAVDTSGEIFHGWFDFPGDKYAELVSRVNGLPREFVEKAVIWDKQDRPVDLDRLRTVGESLGKTSAIVGPDSKAGYSSQGSRRKLGRGFCMIEKDGKLVRPEKISDLLAQPALLSEFQAPGKYSYVTRKPFDMSFLKSVKEAEFFLVEPKTAYQWWTTERHEKAERTEYLEIRLALDGEQFVFGNLPISLLVPNEDFTLHGFGVGILAAGEPAEQRALLIERGPLPSFGYLVRPVDGATPGHVGVNTHERGLEQVFIRTRWEKDVPRIEVVLTSYERMVDLVKYEIEVPAKLVDRLRNAKLRYIPPLFRTYKDDNLR